MNDAKDKLNDLTMSRSVVVRTLGAGLQRRLESIERIYEIVDSLNEVYTVDSLIRNGGVTHYKENALETAIGVFIGLVGDSGKRLFPEAPHDKMVPTVAMMMHGLIPENRSTFDHNMLTLMCQVLACEDITGDMATDKEVVKLSDQLIPQPVTMPFRIGINKVNGDVAVVPTGDAGDWEGLSQDERDGITSKAKEITTATGGTYLGYMSIKEFTAMVERDAGGQPLN